MHKMDSKHLATLEYAQTCQKICSKTCTIQTDTALNQSQNKKTKKQTTVLTRSSTCNCFSFFILIKFVL